MIESRNFEPSELQCQRAQELLDVLLNHYQPVDGAVKAMAWKRGAARGPEGMCMDLALLSSSMNDEFFPRRGASKHTWCPVLVGRRH
jgi:hypothetical protein